MAQEGGLTRQEQTRVRRRWVARRRRSIIRGHHNYLDSEQLVMLHRMYTNMMEEALRV